MTDLPAVMANRSGAGGSRYGIIRARWVALNTCVVSGDDYE